MAETKTKMVKVCAGAFSVFCAAAAKQKKDNIEAEIGRASCRERV